MKIKANVLHYKDPTTGQYIPIPVVGSGNDSDKQDKTDNNLITTSKEIVGAINEIATELNSLVNGDEVAY